MFHSIITIILFMIVIFLSVYIARLQDETLELKRQITIAKAVHGVKTDKSDNYINKFIWHEEVWFDITDSTVSPEVLKRGYIAYDCTGKRIVGELDV